MLLIENYFHYLFDNYTLFDNLTEVSLVAKHEGETRMFPPGYEIKDLEVCWLYMYIVYYYKFKGNNKY